MRTTLTIEPDLAEQIEDRRRELGQSLKQVINTLLRAGLQAASDPGQVRRSRTKTFALGLRPGIDAAKLNQLVDELEADRYSRHDTSRRP